MSVSVNVLQGLRRSGNFSDCLVVFRGVEYKLHTLILSACSEFFRESISNFPSDEPKVMEISFRNLDDYLHEQTVVFDGLLDAIYGSGFDLTAKNLIPLSIMADQLLIDLDAHIRAYLTFDDNSNRSIGQGEFLRLAPIALLEMPDRYHETILKSTAEFLSANRLSQSHHNAPKILELVDDLVSAIGEKSFLRVCELLSSEGKSQEKSTRFINKWIGEHSSALTQSDILKISTYLPITSANALSLLLLYDQSEMDEEIKKCVAVICGSFMKSLQQAKANVQALCCYSCGVLSKLVSSIKLRPDEVYYLVDSILVAKKSRLLQLSEMGAVPCIDDYVALWGHVNLSAISDGVSLQFMKNELVPDGVKIKLGTARIEVAMTKANTPKK